MRSNNSNVPETEFLEWNASTRNYSEGIRIEEEGPSRTITCASHVEYAVSPQNFKESLQLERKMLPYDYCSTLEVDGQEQDSRKYAQEIRFKPKWVVRRFEETVYNYPKETVKRYVSTLTYNRNSKPRTYVSGLHICAPVNSFDAGQLSPGATQATTPLSKIAAIKSQLMMNGNSHLENGPKTNGNEELDENCNVFNTTKDITINEA